MDRTGSRELDRTILEEEIQMQRYAGAKRFDDSANSATTVDRLVEWMTRVVSLEKV